MIMLEFTGFTQPSNIGVIGATFVYEQSCIAGCQAAQLAVQGESLFFFTTTVVLPQAIATTYTALDWWTFQRLVADWRKERGVSSSITEGAMSDSYLRIIAMGEKKAVPLILRQMESEGDEPDQWFWALQILTGADPVSDASRGDFAEMSREWLRWAFNNWYVW